MILSSQEIKELIVKENLVSNFIDLGIQLQQCGFDFSLEKVFKLNNHAIIDFDNKERKIPEVEEIPFQKDYVLLPPGAYKIRFNEILKLPANLAVIAQPRSGLVRSGVTVATGFWDPGFEGKTESSLIISNAHGIKLKKNARLIQVIFMKLTEDTKNLYNGEWTNIQNKKEYK